MEVARPSSPRAIFVQTEQTAKWLSEVCDLGNVLCMAIRATDSEAQEVVAHAAVNTLTLEM